MSEADPESHVLRTTDYSRPSYGLVLGGFVLLAVHLNRPELLLVAALCLVALAAPALLDRPALPAPGDAVRVGRTLEVRVETGGGGGSREAAGTGTETAEQSVERVWQAIEELPPDEPVAEVVDPGDRVRVRVTVENASDGWLPLVQICDRPPAEFAVDDGSRAHATTLASGTAAAFEYVATAPRGDFEWSAPEVTLGTLSGRTIRSATLPAGGADLRTASDDSAVPVPVRAVSSPLAGRLPTGQPGEGLEFFATREYRPGDALNRIDWNRLARTGDLGTVQFRTEHLASVVLLVDARRAAYLAPDPESEHAVDRSVRVARRTFEGLLDEGNRVGIASLAQREVWLPPRVGHDHRAAGRELLLTHEAFDSRPPGARLFEEYAEARREERKAELIERIDTRIGSPREVILFSPCCDTFPGQAARRLSALGHNVSVVSPDPTADREPGHRVRRLQRGFELRQLRRDGVRVIDWGDGPFDVALRRSEQRWSR